MSAILSPDPGSFHQQAEVSSTLPADWYFDPAIYELEHQRIFYRSWWYLCHQSRVDQAGARYVDKIGERPVELLNSDGELQAWCLERRVRLENYAGFLFVNLDDDAVPLKQQASAFIGDMYDSCPELDQLVPVRRFEREIAANWKIVVENYIDGYHLAHLHSDTLYMYDHVRQESGFVGPHYVFFEPLAQSYLDGVEKQSPMPVTRPPKKRRRPSKARRARWKRR